MSGLENGRIVHLERDNTEPGPLLEMVLALDEITRSLFLMPKGHGHYERGVYVGQARALAQCIAWMLGGEYTVDEVKEMNLLRHRRKHG